MAVAFVKSLVSLFVPAPAPTPNPLSPRSSAVIAAATAVFSQYGIVEDAAYPLDIEVEFRAASAQKKFSLALYSHSKPRHPFFDLTAGIDELVKNLREIKEQVTPSIEKIKESNPPALQESQMLYQLLMIRLEKAKKETGVIIQLVNEGKSQFLDVLSDKKLKDFLAGKLYRQLKTKISEPISLNIVKREINPAFEQKISAEFNKVKALFNELASSIKYPKFE